jgi:capsule polysaccharide modification protein KpsS
MDERSSEAFQIEKVYPLNILYLTQGSSFGLFWEVAQAIRIKTNGKYGFYIADSRFFEDFRKKYPAVDDIPAEWILKEWEIIAKSCKITPNTVFLKEKEREIGDPVFWNALIADRRIYWGEYAVFKQNYRPRFDHKKMMAVLQVAALQISQLFDRLQPAAVVGFICVTIGEYLAYLEAKKRNIPFVNLRPTRIKNFFYAGESIFEPSFRLNQRYKEIMNGGGSESTKETARQILASMRETHAMYEGVIPISDNNKSLFSNRRKFNLRHLGQLSRNIWDCNLGSFRHDTHYTGTLYPYYNKFVRQPAQKKINDFFLRSKYVRKDTLPKMHYAFYPLHKEPEVTLLVYSRPYLNQIEVVRNFARSLPVDMKLLVKEHPACVGYRPRSYYRKLLEIPNVVLSPPEFDSRSLVNHAKLVCIISGSIGLEALMLKKPVIHFGSVPFEFLPNSMIRRITDLEQIATIIDEMIEKHQHDEAALIAYFSAVLELSVPVDFYSVLLGRRGGYRPETNDIDEKSYAAQVMKLSSYILDILLYQK